MTILGNKKGNITAAFGAELLLKGTTSIPNLLLLYYKKMGITESEMMLLIMLFHFREDMKDYYPSAARLAENMTMDEYKIRNDLVSLMEKQLLAITQKFNHDTNSVHNAYDFTPLYERISELWACDEMLALQLAQKALKEQEELKVQDNNLHDMDLAKVYKAFEQEFGRLLSPMEIDQIRDWLEENPNPEIVLEGLKTSVLQGKRSFKYIDSILFEWKKKGIKTINEVEELQESFMNSRNKRNVNNKAPKGEANKSKPGKDLNALFFHRG